MSDYSAHDAVIERLRARYSGADLEKRVRYVQWKKETDGIKDRLRAVAAMRANRKATP